MKTTFQLVALAFLSLAFSSCCGLLPCTGSLTAEKKVTTYVENERTVYANKTSQVITERIPVNKTKKVRHFCFRCGSSFNPKPQCCGIISPRVLARATTQGGTGEPGIGLIPTMKELSPSNQ